MLNHIVIMGRLVAAPELKQTGSGTKVTTFRIACDRDYSSGEEKQVDFVDCVAWRSTAEFICRNFRKGMPITVDGRLQIREYKDRDGNNRRVAEINANTAYFCGGERTAAQTSQAAAFADVDDDNELPWKDDDEGLPL
jgi:single-strand DNA-binding protein